MKTVNLGKIFHDKIEIDVLQMKSLTWQLYWFWDLAVCDSAAAAGKEQTEREMSQLINPRSQRLKITVWR